MSKEPINEMAECCPYFWNGACTVDAAKPTDCDLMCEMFGFMTSLVNAGYRKQSEGVWKFNQDGSGTCSECHFTQRGVWDYDNYQNFCGVCGAKMKGGERQ